MNLRPRKTQPFPGFTKAEVQKMEDLLNETQEKSLGKDFFKKLTNNFNCSINRAGKPCLKWTEIQSWFEKNQQECLLKETSSYAAEKLPVVPKMPESVGDKCRDASTFEFEARSKDGAWYDVDAFLSHRFPSSDEVEVCIRFVGFGADEDEWVNLKKDVRQRSVPFDHSECKNLKVGDQVLCFQENKNEARYYDGHVIEIETKVHDVRGCRCLFLIRYDHDNAKERVPLRSLCRPKFTQIS